MIRRLLLAPLFLLAALLGRAPAFADALPASGANHITPTLVAETDRPAAGSRIALAFAMKPAPTWHGYWKNPGDAGLETLVEWTAPKGLVFGPLHYPVPDTLVIAGLMNYVYERDYAYLVTLDVPRGLAPGTRLPISAKLDWLACNPSVCVPETGTFATTLTIGDGAIDAESRARFDRWRATMPKPLGGTATFQVKDGRFRIAIPLPAAAKADTPYFFAGTDKLIDYAAPQTVARDGDRLVIETAARGDPAATITGLLKLGPDQGLSVEATRGGVAAAPSASAGGGDAQAGAPTFLLAFGLAILGGLLLNIMPCVFPILSLKALGLARAGHGEAAARAEALAYAAGVILVCTALGGALLALRSAGAAAGWAFQLQDVRVILVLLLLVSAIGFNLAGLFELPAITGGDALASKSGAAGAFWTGALAAFIATPCTGPFMGAALGAALVLPAAAALAIFAGLGLGLALPFLALGFIPALRRAMPKPGAWMDTFRHILAVPMFLTAIGLAWIAGRQAGANGMALALVAALALVLSLWWVGRRQGAFKTHAWWPLLPGLIAAAAIVAVIPKDAPAAAATAEGSEKFDEARLASLRAEGRPVFLYFTADWCLTCKVNEGAAIERAEVKKAFADRKVATMVGDWTRGDPAISRFLARHGRSGVPFYLYYPAHGEPRELPQVLTPGLLAGLG